MVKRYCHKVCVNGVPHWIHGYSIQELFDNYVKLLVNEGLIEWVDNKDVVPLFGDYLKGYYGTFKQKQQSNTVVNRQRVIRNHIEPAFGSKRMDRIRTTDIQRWFNSLARTYSKETILKIKNVMSPVFDAAVEDGIIDRNPMASKRIEIGGKETVHHKAIPREKMEEIKQALPSLPERERLMAGLLCYTGMRFEEVLGLTWQNVDEDMIHVSQAVVHPDRNKPVIKSPKTVSSNRWIPMPRALKYILGKHPGSGFVLHTGDHPTYGPLSYSEARRVFERIRDRFNIHEYTAHDFRDTCATEWRENGIPLDIIARMLGHSKTETTEKRYVKYREDMMEKVRDLM